MARKAIKMRETKNEPEGSPAEEAGETKSQEAKEKKAMKKMTKKGK